MSGGEFDYNYCRLDVYKGRMEDPELNKLLEDFQELLHDLEWYKSGDSEEEDYRKTVNAFKQKWLETPKEERTKAIVDEEISKLKQELYKCFDIKEENFFDLRTEDKQCYVIHCQTPDGRVTSCGLFTDKEKMMKRFSEIAHEADATNFFMIVYDGEDHFSVEKISDGTILADYYFTAETYRCN